MFFKVYDKVEFPLTQSTNPNNELSMFSKVMIKNHIRNHTDFFVIESVEIENGEYIYKIAGQKFKDCDLVPYGHSNIITSPIFFGNRVKCHCGKTHTFRGDITTESNVSKTFSESRWTIKVFNTPYLKPRGIKQYTKYVAYCPECADAERLRNMNALDSLPPIVIQNPSSEPASAPELCSQQPMVEPEPVTQQPEPIITKPHSIWIHLKGVFL